jgi:hypothetical protein
MPYALRFYYIYLFLGSALVVITANKLAPVWPTRKSDFGVLCGLSVDHSGMVSFQQRVVTRWKKS